MQKKNFPSNKAVCVISLRREKNTGGFPVEMNLDILLYVYCTGVGTLCDPRPKVQDICTYLITIKQSLMPYLCHYLFLGLIMPDMVQWLYYY